MKTVLSIVNVGRTSLSENNLQVDQTMQVWGQTHDQALCKGKADDCAVSLDGTLGNLAVN